MPTEDSYIKEKKLREMKKGNKYLKNFVFCGFLFLF
jgi:hypothetical protein